MPRSDVLPRAVVLGASHWHVPLYLEEMGRRLRVVVVSDPDAELAQRLGVSLGASGTDDWRGALDSARDADVAFVFGRHCDMAEMAEAVLEARIPLVIEKPGALRSERVAALAQMADSLHVPTAVAFIQRFGPLPALISRVGRLRYASFQFIAGPPDRYTRVGNAWLLDPALAGGGCFLNLGIHFVDLFRQLSGGSISESTGRFLSSLHETRVEDQAFVTLSTPGGAGCIIQVGYSFPEHPDKRYVAYSASGDEGFVSIDSNGIVRIAGLDGASDSREISVDTDLLYATFVDRVADSLPQGFLGLPGLSDLAAAMTVVDAAYSSDPHAR